MSPAKTIVIIFFACLILTSCAPTTNSKSPSQSPSPFSFLKSTSLRMDVVYGQDNRKDLYAVTDHLQYTLAESTVALIFKENLDVLDASQTRIKGRSYAKTYQLCPEEPFYEQEVAAFCSGFLVGPQTVVTAGHCIEAQNCERVRFAFGYALKQAGTLPSSLPTENIYSCKTVVESQVKSSEPGPDFAVVTLDRPVTNFKALSLRASGQISTGEPLFVVGHPAGLPTKVADGAKVRSTAHAAYFVANLDTYGGNSGSAVFNANTGNVEGILVRGELDYQNKPGSNCQVSNVCKDDGCAGEHVTKIELALPYIK